MAYFKGRGNVISVIIILLLLALIFRQYGGANQAITASDDIKLAAMIYSPSSLSSSDISFLSGNYDLIVLHETLLDDAQAFTGKTLMYKTSAWVDHPEYVGVCCYDALQASNDAWFLHNGGGRIRDPNTGDVAYWMNYKSSGWRTHSMGDINDDLSSYYWVDGVFYDAIQIEKGELENPNEYVNNADVRASMLTLLDDFRGHIQGDFFVNGAPYSTGYDDHPGGALALAIDIMAESDGFYDESVGVNWAGGWYPNDILEAQLGVMDYAGNMRKDVVMSALYNKNSEYKNIIIFYMLGMNDYTYFSFNYKGYNMGSYRDWLSDQASLWAEVKALGRPIGERVKTGDVYRRSYANGVIEFNMMTHTGLISTTPVGCVDSDGGHNIYQYGYVTTPYDTYPDVCTTSHNLKEYRCDGDTVRYSTIDCGADCISGACVGGCNTDADANCDGVVDNNELLDSISGWVNNQVSNTVLLSYITAWVNG